MQKRCFYLIAASAGACLLFGSNLGFGQPKGITLEATVVSGVNSTLATHWATDRRSCQPQHLVVGITAPPANGTVVTEHKSIIIPASGTLGGPQACAGKPAEAVVIYYQSRPGFTGEDSFRYQRTNLDNAQDALNVEISYTVKVKLPN